MDESVLNSENCIVCLMDILGYHQIVNEETPESIHDILLRVISLKDVIPLENPTRKLMDRIKIQVLSDSILILLDLNNLPNVNEGHEYADNGFLCLQHFLFYTALFSLDLVNRLKYLLRGGISIGQYYQQDLNKKENQFILSKAMIEAHELEKMADVPRILVSKRTYEYIEKKRKDCKIHDFKIANGFDGLYFLDLYFSLEIVPTKIDILKGVKEAICLQTEKNSGDIKVIRKCYWLQEYHNHYIMEWGKTELGKNYKDLLVDISPYL